MPIARGSISAFGNPGTPLVPLAITRSVGTTLRLASQNSATPALRLYGPFLAPRPLHAIGATTIACRRPERVAVPPVPHFGILSFYNKLLLLQFPSVLTNVSLKWFGHREEYLVPAVVPHIVGQTNLKGYFFAIERAIMLRIGHPFRFVFLSFSESLWNIIAVKNCCKKGSNGFLRSVYKLLITLWAICVNCTLNGASHRGAVA